LKRRPAVLFVDADNTLWDTDAVFAEAQLGLLAEVALAMNTVVPEGDALAFLRSVDQALAERHHAGLRYPPHLLIRATELALDGMPAEAAARMAWKGRPPYRLAEMDVSRIEQAFRAALARPPALRLGVKEGLERLRTAGCLLFVVTEGAKAKVECNLDRLGLADFFSRVIEAPKGPEFYRRVLRLTGAAGDAFVVGDQLDRDIAPAKAAGLGTIYFPGGFRPKWAPAERQAQPDHVISSFAEVPSIVAPDKQMAVAAG
jgi:putative hydrolase of the HAD superfamily